MSPNPCDRYDIAPISCTLDHDSAAAFATLLSLGADISVHDEDGMSVFLKSVQRNCVNIIEVILQRPSVDINSKSKKGYTAMHFAVALHDTMILKRLVRAGADVNAADDMGLTPLDHAISYGREAAVRFLVACGAVRSAETLSSLNGWI